MRKLPHQTKAGCMYMAIHGTYKLLWTHFNCPLPSCLSVGLENRVRRRTGCEGVRWALTSSRGELGPSPSWGSAGKLAVHLQGGAVPHPILHVKGLVPGSPGSVSLGKVSLIYFCLDLHVLHKDYYLADSNCAYFFCLICSGCITQTLQPILAHLGLWECQNEGIGAFVMVSAGDTWLPLPHPAPPQCSFPSGTGKAPPPPWMTR